MKDEKIDIIPGTEYEIIQNRNRFSYGVDAILLSEFAKARGKTIDLGTGTGIIPIRISKDKKVDKIYGIEIQGEVADMAKRSVELNGLEEKIEIIEMDIKDVKDRFKKDSIRTVISNPPYMKVGDGVVSEDENFAISKHEIKCNLVDIIEAASFLLEPLGRMFMVHRIERLVDICYELRKENIEPKYIRFVHSYPKSSPHLILIEARKHSNEGLKVGEPLIIYGDDGNYTDEILEIYHMKEVE